MTLFRKRFSSWRVCKGKDWGLWNYWVQVVFIQINVIHNTRKEMYRTGVKEFKLSLLDLHDTNASKEEFSDYLQLLAGENKAGI